MKLFGRKKNRRTSSAAVESRASRREALPRGLKDLANQASAGDRSLRGGDPAGLALVLSLVMVVAGAGLFRVWTRSETQALGYEIVAAESRLRAAEVEHARLTVEEATLSSPIRIARVANERLGLHAPAPEQVVDLGSTRESRDTELASAALLGRKGMSP